MDLLNRLKVVPEEIHDIKYKIADLTPKYLKTEYGAGYKLMF